MKNVCILLGFLATCYFHSIAADTWKAYLVQNPIQEVDLETFSLTKTIGPLTISTQGSTISPDGKMIIAISSSTAAIIDMTQDPALISYVSLPTLPTGGQWVSPAISLDGKTAYIAGESQNDMWVCSLDLQTQTASPYVHIRTYSASIFYAQTSQRCSIALSPDGKTLYCNAFEAPYVDMLNTATMTLQGNISLTGIPTGRFFGLHIHPNGKTLYMIGNGSGNSYFLSIPVNGDPLTTLAISCPNLSFTYPCDAFGLSSDGTHAYALFTDSISQTPSSIVDISIPDQTFSSEPYNPLSVTDFSKGLANPSVGIIPNNAQVLFHVKCNTFSPPSSTRLLLCNTDPFLINDELDLGALSTSSTLLITPDQAPTAAFFAAIGSNKNVIFDASSSSSPVGQIATYAWDFGDGSMEMTTTPTIQHTYSSSGTYSVTLTVTNTAGTSTEQRFTGQFVINNGGPLAKMIQSIVIPSEPPPPPVNPPKAPKHFKGKVHRLRHPRHHKYYKLKARWSKSRSTGVVCYRVYKNQRLWKIIPFSDKRTFEVLQHSHKVKKKYAVAAALENGIESTRTALRVKKTRSSS